MKLGNIFLSSGSGTNIGVFDFILNSQEGKLVEIGSPVTAHTSEGKAIALVTDMRTVGINTNPVLMELVDDVTFGEIEEVVIATAQVYHSEKLRPIRKGIVKAATKEEILKATGIERNPWPIPAGALKLLDGTFVKICFDGTALLGPESAHLNIGGLSGQAAKTSYLGLLLASVFSTAENSHTVGSIIFNVKGDDLIYLDKPVDSGRLSENDLAIYASLGINPSPFEHVKVYSPKDFYNSSGTKSGREDATPLSWDLKMVWPYLRYFLGNIIYEDEKVASFLAEFNSFFINSSNPNQRIDTFEKLDQWFSYILTRAEEEESTYAWRSHHKATLWRIRRMLIGLIARSGGLIVKGEVSQAEDVDFSLLQNKTVLVVDIAGLNPDTQAAIIARTLERLLQKVEKSNLPVKHCIVIADELNSFAPSGATEMPQVRKILQKISTQGRYAGISLWGAAQKLSKIDEMVRDNAATRILGINSDSELSSGIYGRISSGLAERLATLEKGKVAVNHYIFRSLLFLNFPRPAWMTGKNLELISSNKSLAEKYNISHELVDNILAASNSKEEVNELIFNSGYIEPKNNILHEPSAFDPENPFDII